MLLFLIGMPFSVKEEDVEKADLKTSCFFACKYSFYPLMLEKQTKILFSKAKNKIIKCLPHHKQKGCKSLRNVLGAIRHL